MAMVILVQGNFRWMGNETFTDPNDPEAGSVYDGAYKGLGPAVDGLAKAGPANSKAALLVYAEGKVLVKQAMGDATSLSASALGSQTSSQSRNPITSPRAAATPALREALMPRLACPSCST